MSLDGFNLQPLLADSGWFELIGAGIFILFWIISAIAGAVAKKKQEQEQKDVITTDDIGRIIREMEAPEGQASESGDGRPAPEVMGRAESERRAAEVRERAEREARQRAEQAAREEAHRRAAELERREAERRAAQRRQRELQERSRAAETTLRPHDEVFIEAEREPQRSQRERRKDRERRPRQPGTPPRLPSDRPAPPPLPSQATMPSSQTVRRTVATDPLVFNTASPTADQKPPIADARRLRQLLNPVTLREQYILTEIFQPPLALRDERQIGV
ncbi:MAG: hypothetical protein ACK4PI_06915 [Tepidisphaerales bacterium]